MPIASPSDPSSATRHTGRMDCNQSVMALSACCHRRLVAKRRAEIRKWKPRKNHHEQRRCLSDFVRAKRLSNGVSQKQLAGMLGVHPMAVKFWEMRRYEPKGANRAALMAYVGLDPAENST